MWTSSAEHDSRPTVTISDCDAPAAEPQLGEHGEDGDRHAVERRLGRPWSNSSEMTGIAATCAHSSQQQRAVARLPLRLGQRPPMRQHGTEVPGRVP